MEHARRAGSRSMELDALRFSLGALMFGSTPVDEGVRLGRTLLAEVSDSREIQAWVMRTIGTLLALDGRVDEGRELIEAARDIFTELGRKLDLAVLAFSTGPLELRVGDHLAAEREVRAGLELTQEMGDRGRTSNLASLLADALLEQDRLEEAERYVELGRASAQADDTSAHASWRMASARLLARRGATDDAVRLAQESIALMASSSEILSMPGALLRQAEVLQLAGRNAEAAEALRTAIEVAARKGALVEMRQAQERLATIAAA